jgi:hypothetical protein
MNTSLNINTHRLQLGPSVVTLLIGFVVVLVLGNSPVQAQANTTTDTTATTAPAVVDSSVTLSASGTVNDPGGAITVSGKVIVNARRVIDTTGASPPLVVLDFDFSNVQGTSGSLKTAKTYVTGDNHVTEIRPLQASDTIIVTCPYFESTKDGLSAKSMLVTATLNFDISSGRVTSGSINVGNNVITSQAVGTVAESM